ncbi:MAG: tyrosine-type recombinase/integrase [Candidatus Bathyarchaeota archaeon]|nr:tyrosine-type recombinase/integrase [Candidatus Bathyarchaeota archaeon]
MEKESKASKKWQDALSVLAPNTRDRYIRLVDRFMARFNYSTLEVLWQKHEEELTAKDSRDQHEIETQVKLLMNEDIRAGGKPQTVAHIYKALQHFFASQDRKKKLDLAPREIPKGESIGRNLVTKDQISQVLDACGNEAKLRNRSLIMFLKDSGLRVGDAVSFNVEAYTSSQLVRNEAGEPFRVFDPSVTRKNKVLAFVVIGPEAVRAFDEYLGERSESGTVPNDQPLFTVERNQKNARKGNRLSPDGGSEELRRLCAHVKNGKRLGAHSFRKYFITSLESAGLTGNWIKRLCGKTIGGAMGQYSKPEDQPDTEGKYPNALVAGYVRSYDRLRVFGNGQETKKKVESLEKQVQGLTSFVESLGFTKDGKPLKLVEAEIEGQTVYSKPQTPAEKSTELTPEELGVLRKLFEKSKK